MISAIWGPPQSGKTTLAAEMAMILGNAGKFTCIVSAEDFCEMSLRFGLDVPPEKSIAMAIKELQNIRHCALEIGTNTYLLGASSSDSALNLAFSKAQADGLLRAADSIFDEVLVDCTTWTANALTGEGVALAENLFVPIPALVSAQTWCMANQPILEQKAEIAIYVQNHTSPDFDFETLEKQLPLISSVLELPYIHGLTELQNDGKIIEKGEVSAKNVKLFQKGLESLTRGVFF